MPKRPQGQKGPVDVIRNAVHMPGKSPIRGKKRRPQSLIGMPNPLLWGMLAVVLRFIPYIGPILAAMFPMALSIAVDPGWTMLLWTISLFVTLELVSNNVLEPWLYGAKTGLSPIAIILSAIFWTWLRGPVGLLLATPLTVCLFVLGHHVPQFAFLDVLLGSESVLTPAESLHQRLLALNPDEATENAEEYLEKHSLEEFYSEVGIPALVSIERDRARGAIDEDRRSMVFDSIITLIENLSDVEDKPAQVAAIGEPKAITQIERLPKGPPRPDGNGGRVLCIGARATWMMPRQLSLPDSLSVEEVGLGRCPGSMQVRRTWLS